MISYIEIHKPIFGASLNLLIGFWDLLGSPTSDS